MATTGRFAKRGKKGVEEEEEVEAFGEAGCVSLADLEGPLSEGRGLGPARAPWHRKETWTRHRVRLQPSVEPSGFIPCGRPAVRARPNHIAPQAPQGRLDTPLRAGPDGPTKNHRGVQEPSLQR